MNKTRLILTIVLSVFLGAFSDVCYSQTQSNPPGTVAYTSSAPGKNPPCTGRYGFGIYVIYSGWHFTDSNGGVHTFAGSSASCDPIPYATIDYTLQASSADGLYSLTATGPTGVVISTPGTKGFITPKYVVVGVTYAPPGGSGSSVTYTNTTFVGNTTTIMKSFSNNAGFSVTDALGGTINAGFFSGGFTITATESTNYTQGSSSSNTISISKASTVAYLTPGTPVEAPVTGDEDYIWIWLNPELFMTYIPPVGNTPGSVAVTGYGMDPNDPATGLPQTGVPYTAGPDVVEVQVGCLNGHIVCGSDLVWSNGEAPGSFVTSGLLARSWQSSANGYYWPSGEQSGLSFNDVCQILAFDPLAITPSQCPKQNDYTLLNSLPGTTSDGRFTKIPSPPNPIQYPVGGANESYNMVQTNTQSQSTGNNTQIQQAFSVSEMFSASTFFGLTSDKITFNESDTLTWNYSSLDTLTTTTTLMKALSVTGPPDVPTYPSNQPVEFIGYQDNTFGTFAFVPVNYCPSGSIICTQ